MKVGTKGLVMGGLLLAAPAWAFLVEEHLDFGSVTYTNSGYGKWGASEPDPLPDTDIDGVDSDGDGNANWCPRADIAFPQDAVSNGIFTVPAGFMLDHRYAPTLIPYNYPLQIDISSRGNHSFFFWFDQHGSIAGGTNDAASTGCIIRYRLTESNGTYIVDFTGSEQPSAPWGNFNAPFLQYTNVMPGSNGFIDVTIAIDPSPDGRLQANRATGTLSVEGVSSNVAMTAAGYWNNNDTADHFLSIHDSDGTAEIKSIDVIMVEPGDANMDGVVDLADTAIVCSNLLQGAGFSWIHGDFDGDGVVTRGDKRLVPKGPPKGMLLQVR